MDCLCNGYGNMQGVYKLAQEIWLRFKPGFISTVKRDTCFKDIRIDGAGYDNANAG